MGKSKLSESIPAQKPKFRFSRKKTNAILVGRSRQAWITLVLLGLNAGLAGCTSFQPAALDKSQQRVRALESERDLLQRQIETRDKQMAGLQLESLEQIARIRELEASLQMREQELGQTRERYQRIETRVQSLTGPAQAAAAIAEAEATYQVAMTQREIDPTDESTQEIPRLLEAATTAYKAADYAAAADLGDQVIRRISDIDNQRRPAGAASEKLPERPLANPLAFRVRVKSHVRGGPGMRFAPRATLRAETEVKGLATRGQWVKISAPGEVRGWIYRKLLAAPD